MKAINLLPGFFSCLFVAPAVAGGFDILGQPNDVLFEPGRYIEFGLGFASPSVEGQITAVGQRLGGNTDISVFAGGVPAGFANVDFEDKWAAGYVVGGAFEIPEAHVRVAVTYNSAIDYDLDTSGAYLGATNVETPQSVNIDLQAPISLSTLLFATVRWAEWSETTISPPGYPLGSLTHFNDTTTYRLGVVQMLNENWAGFTALTYEPETDASADAPIDATDGLWGATLGAIYTKDKVKVTTAVSYYQFGDASGSFGSFADNEVVSAAVKVGYSF